MSWSLVDTDRLRRHTLGASCPLLLFCMTQTNMMTRGFVRGAGLGAPSRLATTLLPGGHKSACGCGLVVGYMLYTVEAREVPAVWIVDGKGVCARM